MAKTAHATGTDDFVATALNDINVGRSRILRPFFQLTAWPWLGPGPVNLTGIQVTGITPMSVTIGWDDY